MADFDEFDAWLDRVLSAGSSFGRGIGSPIGTGTQGLAIRGPGALTPQNSATLEREIKNSPTYKLGKSVNEFFKRTFPTNDAYSGEFWTDLVPNALGQAIPFLLAGAVGGPIGAALGGLTGLARVGLLAGRYGGPAIMGSLSTRATQFEDALDHNADIGTALKAADHGTLIGATEGLPIGRLLNRTDDATGGMLRNQVVRATKAGTEAVEGLPIGRLLNRMDDATGGMLRNLVVRATKAGTEEAVQEMLAGAMLAASAAKLYDPGRGIWTFDRLQEGSVGFVTGALLETLLSAVSGKRRRGQNSGESRQPGAAAPQAPPEAAPQAPPEAAPQAPPEAAPQAQPEILEGEVESARRQAQALSPGDKASVIPDERLAEGREDLAAIQATDKANQALKNEGFTVRIGDEIVLLDDANEPITGQLIDRNEGGLFVRFPVQGDIPITTRLSKANLTGKSDGTDATTLHLPTGLLRGRMTQIDNADALISARPTLSRTVLGDDIAITATGRKVPVETAIVNIDDLIPSRTEDGNKNPDYPAALRPTARTPLERMTQIVAIANQADPERLDGDPRASDGAPIVSDDGFVESGSLRVLGLKMAYQQGKADRYRQHLIDQGYDVEGVAKPILVRIQTKRMPLEERARIMTEANDRSLDPLFNPPPAATPVLPDSDAPPLRGPPLSQDKANQRLQPVAGFLKELGVTVRVINRSKLPESKPGQTKGYTDGSTLFVVADAHQNPGDLLATLARQLIGVMGLEHTMPENDWNLLQEQIKKTVKASEVAKRLMEQAKQTHNAADDPSMTKAFFVEAVQSDSLDSRTENLLAWTRLRINRQLQAMGLSRPLPVNDINKTMGEQQEYAPLRNSNQSMFRRAINATPIDWVLRLPFEFFGGLDNEGRWVIGQQAYTKIVNFVQNARFDDSVPFNRALNKLLQRARVEVIDRYELPDDYKAMDRQRQIDREALLDQGEALAKQILGSELSRTESEALHAAVTGRGLPPNAVEGLSKDIIHAIDDMGQRAVLTGMLPLDAYMRNRGAYLHRMYKQHETDSAQGFFYQLFQSAVRKIRGNQFKGRGKFERVKLDNLRKHLGDNAEINDGDQFQLIESLSEETGHVYARHFIPVGQQTPQGIRVSRNQGIWTVREINGNKAIVWRDYTDAELQEMGEIRDPAYTVAKTISLMAEDVSTGEFFADIAKDPNLAREEEPAEGTWRQASEYTRKEWGDINIEWVQVPETKIRDSQTKRYGKLAGLYVRPAIWRDITAIEDSNKASLWRDILGMWKRNKTVYSPVVHVNNIASNFVLMYMADVRAVDFISAIRSFAKKDSLYQEARANRIFQNNFAANELNTTVIEPFLKELDLLAQDADTVKGQLAFLLKMYGGLGKVWKSTVGLYTDGMQKAYQFEDSLGRLAVYISARNKGVNVERAADLSITQMLDYNIRAPGINSLLARGGLLPFISFSYRASTRMTEALFVRPWKFMALMSVLYGVERLFYAMRGDDEEDRDQQNRLLRETEQGRLFGIGPKRMFPTPMVDEHDNPVNIDIRRFFPLSDVFDQGHSYLPLPAPLTPTGPLVMMFEIFLNRSAFLDKPIVNPLTDTPMEQLVGFADYAYKSWMPSMALIPNSHYNEKVMRALKGGLDPKGHPYTVHQAVLSSLGIKLRPMDTDMMFQWRKRDFDRTERALRHELSLLKYKLKRRMINQDAYKKQVQQLLNKFYRLNKKRMRVLYGKDVEELNGR